MDRVEIGEDLSLGQMGTLGLETVLISNVVQGVLLAIGSDPGDGSTDLEGRVLQTDILQLGGLLTGNTITGLITGMTQLILSVSPGIQIARRLIQ